MEHPGDMTFDRPGTSNGPTDAIIDRLAHLRGSALDLRNLTNYIARSLLETGARPCIGESRSSSGAAKTRRKTGNQ
jgi:hypothetical protein